MSLLYPLALKLENESVLVVGGGELARHKARELLLCGALVTAIAPEWRADFSVEDDNPSFHRVTREFRAEDLGHVRVVIAATDDVSVQETVAREAFRRGLLCNVVDVPDLCNFYVPAVLRRGDLTVAVSTAGLSPILAGRVRDAIARLLGPHLGGFLARLGEARDIVRHRFPSRIERRREALIDLLSPDAVEDILENRPEPFESRWRAWESSLSD